jgi:hypothetical protein
MANKKYLHLFLGIVLILLGGWFGLIVGTVTFNLIRDPGRFSNPWLMGGLVLRVGLGAFCVWIGSREFQRATGQQVRKPRFRWGRMLAGASLVFISLQSHISPGPNAFKAENDAQAGGMLMAATLMVLVGLWLIASSFKARKSQPQLEPVSENSSAQGENIRVP